MRSGQNQIPIWLMTTLTLCITSAMTETSYSSSLDSALFIRLPNFDGYLHTTYTLTSLTPITSIIDCTWACMLNKECGSFFYLDETKKLCQTHSVLFVTTDEAKNSPNASYYQLTQTGCPHEKGYIFYRPANLCYQYFHISVTADTAKENCEAIQNHLIDVKTPSISNHIVSFLTASSTLRMTTISTGARKVNGYWYWSDGAPVSWTNFEQGEPSEHADNMCLTLHWSFAFKWDDYICNDGTKHYICQLDI